MPQTIPATIRVSYDLLKEVLRLPDDVNVLGIYGADDVGGSFPLLIETPAKYLKQVDLKVEYRKDEAGTTFTGFR